MLTLYRLELRAQSSILGDAFLEERSLAFGMRARVGRVPSCVGRFLFEIGGGHEIATELRPLAGEAIGEPGMRLVPRRSHPGGSFERCVGPRGGIAGQALVRRVGVELHQDGLSDSAIFRPGEGKARSHEERSAEGENEAQPDVMPDLSP